MKNMQTFTSRLVFLGALGLSAAAVYANETVDNAKEAGRDLKKGAKKAGRNVKDKTCEMVNGKMECAAKKVKHKAQNAGDEVKDKVDDVTK